MGHPEYAIIAQSFREMSRQDTEVNELAAHTLARVQARTNSPAGANR